LIYHLPRVRYIFTFLLLLSIYSFGKSPKYYSDRHLDMIYRKVSKSSDIDDKALRKTFYYYKRNIR